MPVQTARSELLAWGPLQGTRTECHPPLRLWAVRSYYALTALSWGLSGPSHRGSAESEVVTALLDCPRPAGHSARLHVHMSAGGPDPAVKPRWERRQGPDAPKHLLGLGCGGHPASSSAPWGPGVPAVPEQQEGVGHSQLPAGRVGVSHAVLGRAGVAGVGEEGDEAVREDVQLRGRAAEAGAAAACAPRLLPPEGAVTGPRASVPVPRDPAQPRSNPEKPGPSALPGASAVKQAAAEVSRLPQHAGSKSTPPHSQTLPFTKTV